MAKVSLTIKESTRQIEAKIRKALIKDINTMLVRSANKMVSPIRNLVRNKLLQQPEIASLSGNKLAGEFGLPDGRNRIENIIEIWVNNIVVNPKKASSINGQINGGISINVIQSDYKDVLSTSYANIITEKGQNLPWLEWLLKFGDKTIVRDFDVSFNPGRFSRSRSGLAVMIRGRGKRWNVPPEFSGTIRNNFVTRALDSIDTDITNIIEQQIKSSVK